MSPERRKDLLMRFCYPKGSFDYTELLDYTDRFLEIKSLLTNKSLLDLLIAFGVKVNHLTNDNIIVSVGRTKFIICKYFDVDEKEFYLEKAAEDSSVGATVEADYYVEDH